MPKSRIDRRLLIEELESRIAPSAFWEELGGSATGGGLSNTPGYSDAPSIAVDADGFPIVVWSEEWDGQWEIYARRWNGSVWAEMGGSATNGGISNNSGYSYCPWIAICGDGSPVVAWHDTTSSYAEIYVRRWDGNSWVEMGAGSASGGGISNAPGNNIAVNPIIAIDPDGRPAIAWYDSSGGDYGVYVRRWDGSSWVEMGAGSATGWGVGQSTSTLYKPAFAFSTTGAAILAWWNNSSGDDEIYARYWDGNSWIELADSATGGGISNNDGGSYAPSAVFGTDDNPIITWFDNTYTPEGGGDSEIFVRYWDGSSWVEMGTGSATYGGISNNDSSSILPRIALGGDGNPIIVWQDSDPLNYDYGEIFVRQWDGTTWVEMTTGSATGGGISNNTTNSQFPAIAIGINGFPVVAWRDLPTASPEVYLREYTPPLPIVRIQSATPTTAESGSAPGVFIVSRTGDTSDSLTVNYELSTRGNAVSGVDYVALSGSVTIPEGETSATITITPIDDAIAEGTETVVLNLLASNAYLIGPPRTAVVAISDDITDPWIEVGSGSASGRGISQVESASFTPAIAVTENGRIFVAWSCADMEIYVRCWNGSSWVELGGSASGGGISNNPGWSMRPAIAVDPQGRPVVAWVDRSDGHNEIYVRRWEGSTWAELDGSATGWGISGLIGYDADYPCIVIGSDGNPIVAWQETGTNGYNSDPEIYLKRWDGSSWVEIGGSASAGGVSNNADTSMRPAMCLGTNGGPILVWEDSSPGNWEIYARYWDGSSWSELGGSATNGGISNNGGISTYSSIVLGTDGNPIVAWTDITPGEYEVYVRRWDGTSWVEMGTGSATGGGISNTSTKAQRVSMSLCNGKPVVAWEEMSAYLPYWSAIYVRAWNGSSWVEMGVNSASGQGGISGTPENSYAPVIAEGTDGNPIVAWQVAIGSWDAIYVRRYSPLVLPTVTILATDADASEPGVNKGEFTITRTGSVSAPLVVTYTVGGTATNGSDYQALGGSVTIGAGVASAVITVSPIDDILVEGTETVILTLSASEEYTIGSASVATVTIADNDLPAVSILATDPNAAEKGPDPGVFTISRTGTAGDLVVTYVVGGTATNGVDYDQIPNSITLGAGQASATITVKPVDDTLPEGPETVILTLTTSGAYTIAGSDRATVTIVDNEIPLTPGKAVGFTDGDGTAVTVTLGGPGTGYFTLKNGDTSGDYIAAIVLENTTDKSSLTIKCKGGTVSGTSFANLDITKLAMAGGAMGTVSLAGVSLDAGGIISANGFIKTITLGDVGNGAHIIIGGNVDNFTAGALNDSALIEVGDNLGTLKATSIGDGMWLHVIGDIKTLNLITGHMNGHIQAEGPAGIGAITITKGGMDGSIQGAGIKSLTVGGGNLMGHVHAVGTAGIGTISVPKGILNGTIGAAQGGIKTLTFGGTVGDLTGLIEAGGTAGIGTLTVSKRGLDGATISAFNTAGAGIKTLTVNGGITGGVIVSNSIAGIGTITVKGDTPNLVLNSAGPVNTLNVTGSAKNILTLGGEFDVKVLKTLNANFANAQDLVIRGTDGVGNLNLYSMNNVLVSGGTIGNVKVGQNVTNSLLLAGYDIGANHVFEYEPGNGDDAVFLGAKANIGTITIGGTMIGTSIAANVNCGSDHKFGVDDVVLVPSLTAGIKALTVKGTVGGGSTASGIQFGVVGQTMGAVTIGGKKQSLPYTSEDGQVSINLVLQQPV